MGESPSCLESQRCHLIPISSLVSLRSPVAIFVSPLLLLTDDCHNNGTDICHDAFIPFYNMLFKTFVS